MKPETDLPRAEADPQSADLLSTEAEPRNTEQGRECLADGDSAPTLEEDLDRLTLLTPAELHASRVLTARRRQEKKRRIARGAEESVLPPPDPAFVRAFHESVARRLRARESLPPAHADLLADMHERVARGEDPAVALHLKTGKGGRPRIDFTDRVNRTTKALALIDQGAQQADWSEDSPRIVFRKVVEQAARKMGETARRFRELMGSEALRELRERHASKRRAG